MKTLRIISFILGLLLFYSCQKNPVIHAIHVDVTENHQDTIVLTNYTDFDWDRALFFNDYLTCAYHEKDHFLCPNMNSQYPLSSSRMEGLFMWK